MPLFPFVPRSLFSLGSRLLFRPNLSSRPCSSATPSNLFFLTPEFALSAEWEGRLGQLSVDQLGGDNFEWIVAVQKKFSAGGKASAVDLDLACSMPTDSDQLVDLVDLCYKFRHTDAASDLLPSTEYTLCRLLFEFGELDTFVKLLNDPINYGAFPNEHICCMFLARFLSSAQLQYAVKVAVYVMLQEMFHFPLLNFLATKALLEWTELSDEERVLDEQIHPKIPPSLEDETDFNEENVHLFRYPFLKNPFWDGHFDENDSDRLVGKSLEWLSWHLKLAKGDKSICNETLIKVIRLVGLIFQRKWTESRRLTQEMFNVFEKVGPSDESTRQMFCSVVGHFRHFSKATEEQMDSEKKDDAVESAKRALGKLLDKKGAEFDLETAKGLPTKLSEMLTTQFQPILSEEEGQVVEQQRKNFEEWTQRRKKLIHTQAQRAEHLARLNELKNRNAELKEQRETLFFFENRIRIEDEARERTNLIEELGLMKRKGELTEEEYAQGIFHLARQLKEGKTAKQALEEISGSDLLSRLQKRSTV